MDRRRAIVVLSMHRSGTSALARLLMLLGADAPKNIMPPDPGNTAGHWEPVSIVHLQEEMFESTSSSWDDLDPLPSSWFKSAPAREFHHRAVEVLREEYGDSRLFVVKDPRMCRAIPFWRSAFAEYGAEPSFVITVRNPVEVAASLTAREGIVPARGLLLWLRHMLEAEFETRGHPRVFVSYERTLENWRSVAERISKQLEIAWPGLTERAEVEIESFLSSGHRHHAVTREELEARPEIAPWVKSAFAVLERATSSGAEPGKKVLDKARSLLDDADLVYGPVLAESELDAGDKAAELERVSHALADKERKLRVTSARNRGLLETAEHRADKLERAKEELEREIRASRALARTRADDLQRTREELERSRAELEQALAKTRSDDLQRIREELERSRAELEHELQSSQALAERRTNELGRTQEELDNSRAELAREARATQALADWTGHLESSRSWRITAPMRSVAALIRRLVGRSVAQPHPPPASRAAPPLLLSTGEVTEGPRPEDQRRDGLPAQIREFTNPGDSFEEFDPAIATERARRAKLLAFYLPQFHPIPENDRWWGKGFTEWRNVARGMPRFAGHYQPRIPRDLGFYDLRNPETIRRQAELAGQAGLHGFAFYYYSFGGKRLLERPLEEFLAQPSIDFPFCVVWANENWTRRWDGLDTEILMAQDHDPNNDKVLIDDLQRHFEDPRYIRIEGRPLLPVYRLDIIPDARATVARWRKLWKTRHGEQPLIFLVQAFDDDPRTYGADGAIEFPPQRLASWDNAINGEMRMLDASFSGYVLDYERVAEEGARRSDRPYPWIRGVTPSWDNDARRQGEGTVLHGSTPALYQRWLSSQVEAANENPVFGEPFVFINAWNEWAEAAYLEPDVHFGAAYLNATARAVCGTPTPPEKRRVLLVGHDAHPHGAQMNLRGIGATLRDQFGCEIAYLLLEGGTLTEDYESQGETRISGDPDRIAELIRDFMKSGFELALTNTAVTGAVVPPLKDAGFQVITLIHELPGIIRDYGLEPAAKLIAERSDVVVFPARSVAEAFSGIAPIADEKVTISPQGLYRDDLDTAGPGVERVRRELGIGDDAGIVLNIGYADLRKGIDIFVEAAQLAAERAPNLHFVWIGNLSPEAELLRVEMQSTDARLHFIPFTEEIGPYLGAADAFFLSSREDPFPSVVLEALDAGIPVVALRGSGGCEELVAEHGKLVAEGNLDETLSALTEVAADQNPEPAVMRRRVVREEYQYDEWVFNHLRLLDPAVAKVSVVVPNYNYADRLAQRLASIFDQTHPLFEVIVLDDCSEDDSLLELERIREQTGRKFKVVTNDRNSGSPFRQWAKACELARGDYLWIAEADDLCRPEFVDTLAGKLAKTNVAFAFSDSSQIDGEGRPLGDSYKPYYREAVGDSMDRDFVVRGEPFVRRFLVERNLILNASSVIWDRSQLEHALLSRSDELMQYRLAGDWLLYADVALQGGEISYVSDPLNIHRRHTTSVTDMLEKQQHVEEVRRVHEALAAALRADEKTRQRMHDYETELERQFGLDVVSSND